MDADNFETISINFQNQPSPFSDGNFEHFPIKNYYAKEWEQDLLDLNVFHLFDPFLRVGYYLLLIPFRFGKRNNGIYYIHTNIVQQTLSTFLFTLVFLTGVLDLRHHFERGLMPQPEKAFVWSYSFILEIGYTPIWFKTFWFGRKNFEKLLEFCQPRDFMSNKSKAQTRVWTHLITGILIYTEAKLFLEQLYSDMFVKGWTGMLQYYGGIGLYNLHLRKDEELEKEQLLSHAGILAFSCGHTILMNLLRQVEHLVEVMALVGAVAAIYTTNNFIKSLDNLDLKLYQHHQDSNKSGIWIYQGIVTNYTNFMALMNHINSICGCIVLVYMLGMVPTFVWCVFGIFELYSLEYLLYYVHKFVMHLSLLFVAAEANAKGNAFRDWIMRFLGSRQLRRKRVDGSVTLDLENEDLQSEADGRCRHELNTFLNFAHREMCTNPVGLKGASFFTISYGFIGTTVSVIVTYAVIMLQFQVEKYQKLLNVNQTLIL